MNILADDYYAHRHTVSILSWGDSNKSTRADTIIKFESTYKQSVWIIEVHSMFAGTKLIVLYVKYIYMCVYVFMCIKYISRLSSRLSLTPTQQWFNLLFYCLSACLIKSTTWDVKGLLCVCVCVCVCVYIYECMWNLFNAHRQVAAVTAFIHDVQFDRPVWFDMWGNVHDGKAWWTWWLTLVAPNSLSCPMNDECFEWPSGQWTRRLRSRTFIHVRYTLLAQHLTIQLLVQF